MIFRCRNGFTLIEILIVISIILLLAGLLAPALNKASDQAKKQKARAVIGSLEVAVNMYYTDIGEYPGSLGDLITPPDTDYGPYVDDEEFEDGSFKDPWGNDYSYTGKTDGYIISTTAPDGEEIKVEHP